MKKLMLLAFVAGVVATSCGTKEPQVSSENRDSMTAVVDTTSSVDSTPMQSPDTMKMPTDTVTTPMR